MQMELDGIPEAEQVITDSARGRAGDFWAEHFIDHVPKEEIGNMMRFCGPWLDLALQRTEEYTILDLTRYLINEQAMLLIEFCGGKPQGCMVVFIQPTICGNIGHIMAIAGFPGKTIKYPNKVSFGLLGDYLKRWGCYCVQGIAQPAVARLWSKIGFYEVSKLVRKML